MLVAFVPRALAAPSVRAHIEWHGGCRDDQALSEALLARGVQVDSTDTRGGDGPFLSISVQPKAEVGWSAQLELEGAAGSRESRLVEAKNCGDLQRAVAWVLATFAQETLATEAPTQSANVAETKVDVPAAGATGESEPPDVAPSPIPSPTHARSPDSAERPPPAASSSAPRFALGASFMTGVGWLPSVALGPSLHAEYGPHGGSRLTLRLSVARLVSLPFEREEVTLHVDRTFANASARFATGFRPLKLYVGVEAGSFRGAGTGTGLTPSGDERHFWLAGELGAELRFALLRDVLHAELGASGVLAPRSYSLQFGDGQSLVTSKVFEFRGVIGLVGAL